MTEITDGAPNYRKQPPLAQGKAIGAVSSPLAARARRLEPYPFLEIARAAQEVRASGRDVVSLAMGEPDFGASEKVRTAGIRAIELGHTRYTAMDGMPELREAIRTKLRTENSLEYAANEVTVTCGGTQVIFNSMLATLEEGDEVVLLAPYFPVYLSAVQFAGGVPVIVRCDAGKDFRPDCAAIRAALTPRTRWLVLNSPCNPSGATLTAEDLADIVTLLKDFPKILVLSDDIYEAFVFDHQPFRNILNIAPILRDRVLLLNGMSKSYGMTGWRIGYAAGPAWLIEALAQICAISTFTPNSIGQAAAIVALSAGGHLEAQAPRNVYQQRRDILIRALKDIPGLSCTIPNGAFYVFPGCGPLLRRAMGDGHVLNTDTDLALHILRTQAVSVMPGSAFGAPGFLRLSFAAPDEVVMEGARRLALACREVYLTPRRVGD